MYSKKNVLSHNPLIYLLIIQFFLIDWWCTKHHLYIPPKRKTKERGTKANTFQKLTNLKQGKSSLFLKKSALAWDGMSFIQTKELIDIKTKELIDSPIFAKLSAQQFPSLNIWETMKFICFVKSMQFFHLFLMFHGTKDEDLKANITNVESVSNHRLVQPLL